MENLLTALLGFSATLAAAFFGSKYAFQLQQLENLKQSNKIKVESCNRLIFTLAKTRVEFKATQDQAIIPHINSKARQFEIRPLLANPEKLDIKFDELSFMFDALDPNILGELSMFQLQTNGTIEAIAQRSSLHFKAQEVAEKLQIGHGDTITVQVIENAMGAKDAHLLRELTDHMIEGTQEIIDDSEKFIERLLAEFTKLFPDYNFITLDNMPKIASPQKAD